MAAAFKTAMKMKAMFFDAPLILRRVAKARRSYLSKAGAFVRRTARTSIRSSSKPSSPGKPPHSRIGAMIAAVNRKRKKEGKSKVKAGFQGIRHILFAYDATADSVIVGPISNKDGMVPHALEFGGDSLAWMDGKREPIQIAARPFMFPALESEAPKFPDLWKDSVGR
jgi:hypothetical protein